MNRELGILVAKGGIGGKGWHASAHKYDSGNSKRPKTLNHRSRPSPFARRDLTVFSDLCHKRIGELLYGNIGAANRLDVACIGPAVNLAARLEALAARLGRSHCRAGLADEG